VTTATTERGIMNEEFVRQAQRPGSNPLSALTDQAHDDVIETLVAALVYPQALALADALEGEPLQKLREAAAGPLADVAAAREALAEEKKSVAGRVIEFWESKRRSDPDDREVSPPSSTPRVQALQEALQAAVAASVPSESACRSLGYKIDSLRAAPRPDPVILERLGLGRNTACRPRPEKEATS